MNSPAKYMQEWCNETLIKRYDLHLGEDLTILWSFIISIYLVGACIGSLFSATFADKLGRFVLLSLSIVFRFIAIVMVFVLIMRCLYFYKTVKEHCCFVQFWLQLVQSFFISVAHLTSLKWWLSDDFWMVFRGKQSNVLKNETKWNLQWFIFSGMTSGVLGMYLAEIAPSELRGSIAVFYALGEYRHIEIFETERLELL